MYPRSYHQALNALIHNAQRPHVRTLIAHALRALRNTPSVWSGRDEKRISGREWAHRERAHMQFVNTRPWVKQPNDKVYQS